MKQVLFVLLIAVPRWASADSCDTLITQGLRNMEVSYSSQSEIATTYHRYCDYEYDSLDQATRASIDVDVFGVASGDASLTITQKKERLKNWCEVNKSYSQSNRVNYQQSNTVYQGALDAWTACLKLRTEGALQSDYWIEDDQKAVRISLIAQSGTLGIPFLGTAFDGFQCKAERYDASKGLVQVDPTKKTIINNVALKISCSRNHKLESDNRDHLEQGLITVRTGLLKDVSLFFPEEYRPSVDEVTKKSLEDEISSLCLGCVVSAILPEDAFQRLNGKQWKLCNGQSIAGSKLAQETGIEKAPDFRDAFPRGKNSGKYLADGPTAVTDEIDLGANMPDSVGPHHHSVNDPGHSHPLWVKDDNFPNQRDRSLPVGNGPVNKGTDQMSGSQSTGISISDNVTSVVDGKATKETVPKSVTVNFFIKVD